MSGVINGKARTNIWGAVAWRDERSGRPTYFDQGGSELGWSRENWLGITEYFDHDGNQVGKSSTGAFATDFFDHLGRGIGYSLIVRTTDAEEIVYFDRTGRKVASPLG